jgi:hypothetical protein
LRKLVPLIFLVLLSLAPIVNAEYQSTTSYSVKADRIISINDWGVTTVNDTLNISNNGETPLRDMLVGFPRDYSEGLRYITAIDGRGRILAVERVVNATSPICWLSVKFQEPVPPKQKYNFTLTTLFLDLVKFKNKTFYFTFAAYPSLVVDADYCNVTVVPPTYLGLNIPYGFSSTKFNDKSALNRFQTPLKAYANTTLHFNFTSTSLRLVRCGWIEREIYFDPYGDVYVSDSYRIKNVGSTIRSITIQLPKGASEVSAYDSAGPIRLERGAQESVSVSPRYGTFDEKLNFTFTLKYKLPSKNYVKQLEWWGLYDSKLNLTPNLNFIADRLNVVIIMQRGMTIEWISQTPNATFTSSWYEKALVYNFTNVTPLHDLQLEVKYRYPAFWAALRPLGWTAAIAAVACAILVVKRVRKPLAPAVAVPVEIIREFIELYDEKNTLRLELDKMREDLARGALTKHEFRRRRKLIELRVDELSRSLSTVKEKLRATHPRYDEMVRKIERAEAEIDAARASETQILTQYRAGKITKEVYSSLMTDLKKRLDKAKETIDSLIITLREEAR